VVKTMTANVTREAGKAVCSANWPEAELWEVGKPKLYTLSVALLQNGTVIDESLPERFGFREFGIRGKYFYLNDIKLNLVPCSYSISRSSWQSKRAMRHWIKGAMAAGYNFVYLGETDRPGRAAVSSDLLEVCDEMGMLAAVSPLGVGHSVYRRFDLPKVYKQWTEIVRTRIRKDWNHPSLVLWRMNMNLNCYKQDQNPLVLDGKMDFAPGSDSELKEKAMLKSNRFVASLDPTRASYNHACGKTGAIYNLNNYLGWPELQDLREWLRVWATNGEKPLYMAEQATPYPGDFQMRDPTNWWTNEPVMTEYGAILLGERSYGLEEQDYVDYYDRCWDAKSHSWRSSYGYFCHNYPPILDECSSDYYEAMLPAWRTWGISGGVNAWENTWRRLIKRRPNSSYREVPSPVPLKTDWEHLQKPGFSPDEWQYANGGGGEIRCLFDLGRPEEKEYFQPTRRSKVMPELIAPLYAYIGGPKDEWYAQDHAFRTGETVAKSVVLLNDRRKPVTFAVKWQVFAADQPTQGGSFSRTVSPAESAIAPFSFRAPAVTARVAGRVVAQVSVAGESVPVKPFALEFYPPQNAAARSLAGWVLLDPEGKTQQALKKAGLTMRSVAAADSLPEDVRVLVVGCNALSEAAGSKLVAGLSGRVINGLQVVVFEQPAEVLTKVFGLRCFTPGVRRVWVRDGANPILAGLSNVDLRNWRGRTTLGPLAGPPESLDQSQRWQRVWRCSQLGVVASTIVEKPHVSSFRPLLDTGFDLRYTPLWETVDGAGRMVFCQLDVTDRIGLDPVADRLLANLVGSLQGWQPGPTCSAQLVQPTTDAPFAGLDVNQGACPADGGGKVVVLPRGCGSWLSRQGTSLRSFLRSGGTVLAAGLSVAEAKALMTQAGAEAEVASGSHWLNPLHGDLPDALRGIGPAAVHWRKKLDVASVTRVPPNGWRSETGVLATIPVGKGQIVWVSAIPADFRVDQRPDLVFSRVNTERLYTIVLGNLGVRTGSRWADWLGGGAATEKTFYTDKRVPRDDPYADMRW
jgi:hypothetical protein